MTTFDGVEAYPLSWPVGWPRAKNNRRVTASFYEHTLAEARDFVLGELRRLGAKNPVISTNVPLRRDGLLRSGKIKVDDPGAAVYFVLSNQPRVLACDKWSDVVDNLWAIGKHIEAIRGQQRWGVGTVDQAFAGYDALPAPKTGWWQILGVDKNASLDEIQTAYREKAKATHPDHGGDQEEFLRIQRAWEQAKEERK
jgi:hypothetical protein